MEENKEFPKTRKELLKKKYIRVVENDETPAPPKYDIQGETNVFDSKLQPIDLDLMVYQIAKKGKNLATIRRLILYIPFVIFITMWMFFGFEIEAGYWMQHGIRTEILRKPFPYGGENSIYNILPPGAVVLTNPVTFHAQDVNAPLDYYRWLKGIVIPALFVETDLAGNPLPENQFGYLNRQIKNIGGLRIRQHRIKKKTVLAGDRTCSPLRRFVPLLPQFDPDCYEDLGTTGTQDEEPFGPNNTYTYKDCSKNGGGVSYRGRKLTFECGAHTLLIPFNTSRANALKYVDDLIANKWIDKQTKSQIVEWFGYNNNLNFFTSAKFAVEFTRGGALISTWEIDAFRVQPFREALNIVYFAVCMLAPLFLLISVFVYFLDLYNEYKYGTWWHFFIDAEWKFPWINLINLAEVVNLVLIVISFVIRFYLWFNEFTPFDIYKVNNSAFPYPAQLENTRNLTIYDNAIVGTGVILSYFRIFKFFSLNDRLNVISETVKRAASNLGSVVLTQVLSLLAFSVCGWIIFGNDVDDFKDLLSAVSALLRVLIGENGGFDDYFQESRIIFPIFYIAFIFLNLLIVINMIFGVIESGFNDSIVNVVDKSMLFDVKRTAREFIQYGKKILRLERGLNHRSDVKYKINQGDDEVVATLKKYQQQHGTTSINADDVRNALKGGGEETINRIMYRYDTDGDGTIDIRELERASNHKDEEEELRKEADKLKALGKIQAMISTKKVQKEKKVEKTVDEYVKNVSSNVDELLFMLAEELGEEEFIKAQYDSEDEELGIMTEKVEEVVEEQKVEEIIDLGN